MLTYFCKDFSFFARISLRIFPRLNPIGQWPAINFSEILSQRECFLRLTILTSISRLNFDFNEKQKRACQKFTK